jgi:hypothetical protein
MFVKHIIKTLKVSVTIVWPSSGGHLSCLVLLLLLCLFVSASCLFGMWLYVICSIMFEDTFIRNFTRGTWSTDMTLYSNSHSSTHVVIICLIKGGYCPVTKSRHQYLVASYTVKVNCSLIVIKHCQLCTSETSNVVIIACSFSKCHPWYKTYLFFHQSASH